MQYTSLPLRAPGDGTDPRVHASLDALVRLQSEAQGFSLLPGQPGRSLLHGRHASRLRGRGLQFEELRAYRSGDDIRRVDWKATARAGQPRVRVFCEERNCAVWLLVDQRQTMFFGSRAYTKSVVAAQAAALLGWRALAQGDRVGAIVYDESGLDVIPPRRSRLQLTRALAAIAARSRRHHAADPREPRGERLDEALAQVLALARHDGVICLLGDGHGAGEPTRSLVTRLAAHNDVLLFFVHDPLEGALPAAGPLRVTDARRQVTMDTGARRVRERFARGFATRLDAMQSLSRERAMPFLPLATTEAAAPQLRRLLGGHA